ncbi:MAG: tryptophan-rich sensory protein [Gammaproteobacteria bacterium]|nr:tryptophan-rich sensory protein [Gammaproteobacteria bacterium]NND59821.1 tryptophan-rich sensory protein [Gammaproteobacteria bacterium]
MKWLGLAGFLVVVFAIAGVGAMFTPGQWYETLAKPEWNPPNWIFGPVWTVLYVMIAVAGWLVWQREGVGVAMGLYAAQLVCNAAWSWLFFGRHAIGLALIDIVVLLVLIIATIAVFWPVSRVAAGLLVPYALWVGFATTLNATIWRLN